MSTNKILRLVLAGVAAAAVACIVAGLCLYIPAILSQPLKSDPNYDMLIHNKAVGMQYGMLILIVGCVSMIMDFMAFIAMIIIQRLSDAR